MQTLFLVCHTAVWGFLQDSQAQQTFVLDQVRKQAVDLGQATAAMPQRVEQMSSTLSGLEGGEIKLRVRALEVERAARRASIMQVCSDAELGSVSVWHAVTCRA